MAAIRDYTKRMITVCGKKRFWLCNLGEVDGFPTWLIRTRPFVRHRLPKMLVVAGFHGEERAGPYTVLKWLESDNFDILKHVDISFLPLVNPVGFKNNTRYTDLGMKNNQGFCHPESNEKPSREGLILKNNIDLIKPLAEDGYLSLHEDNLVKGYYLYTFEKSKDPGPFSFGLRSELGKFFRKRLHNEVVEADSTNHTGPVVMDGIVYCFCDGSFDDWMFHLGVPRVAVTETPAKFKMKRRIDAGVAVINKFIDLNLQAIQNEKEQKEKE